LTTTQGAPIVLIVDQNKPASRERSLLGSPLFGPI
jgi:hypothetical protein